MKLNEIITSLQSIVAKDKRNGSLEVVVVPAGSHAEETRGVSVDENVMQDGRPVVSIRGFGPID